MSEQPKTYEAALDALTEMQRAFVIAYSGNATEAAKLAGYSSPGPAGCRMLKQSKIQHTLALRDEHEAAIAAKKAANTDVNKVASSTPKGVEQVFTGQRIERMDQLDHVRITREELGNFLSGVVVGAVEEHGVNAFGLPWSGPPKLKDRLKAADMLAKMNNWNAGDGGGEQNEHADPYGHRKLTRAELKAKAQATAHKLTLLQGGG